ncbi:MAG: RNA polymerase sigma factor [Aquaticitalea sp.]
MSALPKLVMRWHKEFCNKAYWLTKDVDVSKDIAQDCWKIIIEKIYDLKDPNRFGSWALRIVYSKSLDWLRANKKERDSLQLFSNDQSELEMEKVDDAPIKKALLKAVLELPEPQRVVINLFYVKEYTLKQIADMMEISIGTAKSRLFHARETLKKQLKNRTYEN